MRAKRKRSFLGRPSGAGFAARCGLAGHLAVIGERVKALSVIKEALAKFKGRAQQYQLLFQGGDCLFALGKVDDAAKIFKEALEAAYEPAAARARIGLARCLLSKGEYLSAAEEINRAIDEAGKAAKAGYAQDGGGTWTLLAVPLCPQAVAMRVYHSFNQAGQGEIGRKILERARGRAVGKPSRLEIYRGKVDEWRGRLEGAAKRYDGALSGVSLGPRSLAALGGWCRCAGLKDIPSLRQKLSGFQSRLADRASLTAVLNLRARGRGAWVEAAKANFDGRAAAELLPLRIMTLGNRRQWGEMREAAEQFLALPGLTAQEGAAGVAAVIEAEWQQGNGVEDLEQIARKAPDRAKARWAGYSRLLHLGDGASCELFFRGMGRGSIPAVACLGRALLSQGKREEAREIFARLAQRKGDPLRCQMAALVGLVSARADRSQISEDDGKLVQSRVDELARKGGLEPVLGLASLVVGLRRLAGTKDLAEEVLTQLREAFNETFFALTDPRGALMILTAMNEAFSVFGGKGGIRDLYLSSAQDCLPMLEQGGADYHRYMVAVYGDTYSLGLVTEASRLWTETERAGPVAAKWRAAREVAEAETRANNFQASAITLARNSYSTFGTGEFAARACYLLSLDRLGKGKSPSGWAVAGLDALGRSRGEAGNLGLVSRLEVLGVEFNRQKLGRLERKWRSRTSFRQVAERVVQDLSRVESPISD